MIRYLKSQNPYRSVPVHGESMYGSQFESEQQRRRNNIAGGDYRYPAVLSRSWRALESFSGPNLQDCNLMVSG
jgi:hypothetical protein